MRCFESFWVNEASSPTVLANFLIHDGTSAVQADITSIAYSVHDVNDPTVAIKTGAPAVADVFYDSLQTDVRWTKDSTGFNFAWACPVDAIPEGGKRYQVEFTTTPVVGGVITDAVQLPTRQLYGT